jgi:phytol kinase
MGIILTILGIFGLLLGNEVWWRRHEVANEFSRKFIHITVGSLVAFWPFYLSWGEIQLLSLAFLVVLSVSKYLHIFQAIHSVQRPTWGELYFAVSVSMITLLTHDKWVYAAAILQMSLADGLAAVIGMRYGKRRHYLVFGYPKSMIGTMTFFVVSIVVLIGFNYYGDKSLTPQFILGTTTLATIIENLAARGLDNLFVPLVVCLLLIH